MEKDFTQRFDVRKGAKWGAVAGVSLAAFSLVLSMTGDNDSETRQHDKIFQCAAALNQIHASGQPIVTPELPVLCESFTGNVDHPLIPFSEVAVDRQDTDGNVTTSSQRMYILPTPEQFSVSASEWVEPDSVQNRQVLAQTLLMFGVGFVCGTAIFGRNRNIPGTDF